MNIHTWRHLGDTDVSTKDTSVSPRWRHIRPVTFLFTSAVMAAIDKVRVLIVGDSGTNTYISDAFMLLLKLRIFVVSLIFTFTGLRSTYFATCHLTSVFIPRHSINESFMISSNRRQRQSHSINDSLLFHAFSNLY